MLPRVIPYCLPQLVRGVVRQCHEWNCCRGQTIYLPPNTQIKILPPPSCPRPITLPQYPRPVRQIYA